MPNYQIATDEELLLLARTGNGLAQNELDTRYCRQHETFIRKIAPDLLRYRSMCDLAAIAFSVYMHCLVRFKLGASTFYSYYKVCLTHELGRARKELFEKRRLTLSIDDEMTGKSDLTYHDVIPSTGIYDDPKKYVDYFDEIHQLKQAPKRINGETLLVARMHIDGYEFKEIAQKLKISLRKVYYRYTVFEEEVRKLIANESRPVHKQNS